MAINYTTLFGDIGEVVLAVEEIEAMMVTVEARRTSMITQFDTSGVTPLINQINTTFNGIIQQMESMISQLIFVADARLKDRETVLEQLPKLVSTNTDNVMVELISDMITNSETVKESTASATLSSQDTTNTDAGDLIITKLVPGNIAPGQGFKQNRFLAGEDSELPLVDTVTVVCTTDSQQRASLGGETFTVSGIQPQQQTPFASNQGGNRGTLSLRVGNSNNRITNFFNTFSVTDTPDDWTIVAGTPTTDFMEETTDIFDDDSALRFNFGTTPALSYNIYSILTPGEVMVLYYYLKRDATAAGTLTMLLQIDGVTIATQAISIGAAQDDWFKYSYVFVVPDDIGLDDGTTFLKFTSGVTTADVLIDGGVLTPMTYFGGIGLAVSRGFEKFLIDDEFIVAYTNDEAGKFQRFFTRAFGWQLPSITSTSETISEPS